MEYLTTHDLVWINNVVTGGTEPYDYVALEAAMAGQYSYGGSSDAAAQAATLLERLLRRRPFERGNMRTAFIATLTFLNANGLSTAGAGAATAEMLRRSTPEADSARAVVQSMAGASATPGHSSGASLRHLIAHECNAHTEALRILAEGD